METNDRNELERQCLEVNYTGGFASGENLIEKEEDGRGGEKKKKKNRWKRKDEERVKKETNDRWPSSSW